MSRSSLADFAVLGRLGSGSYGTVFKVKRKADGQVYVSKAIRIAELAYKEQMDAIKEGTRTTPLRDVRTAVFLRLLQRLLADTVRAAKDRSFSCWSKLGHNGESVAGTCIRMLSSFQRSAASSTSSSQRTCCSCASRSAPPVRMNRFGISASYLDNQPWLATGASNEADPRPRRGRTHARYTVH